MSLWTGFQRRSNATDKRSRLIFTLSVQVLSHLPNSLALSPLLSSPTPFNLPSFPLLSFPFPPDPLFSFHSSFLPSLFLLTIFLLISCCQLSPPSEDLAPQLSNLAEIWQQHQRLPLPPARSLRLMSSFSCSIYPPIPPERTNKQKSAQREDECV